MCELCTVVELPQDLGHLGVPGPVAVELAMAESVLEPESAEGELPAQGAIFRLRTATHKDVLFLLLGVPGAAGVVARQPVEEAGRGESGHV